MVSQKKEAHKKIEFAFKVQGISTARILEILNRLTSENLHFYAFNVLRNPNQIISFGRRAMKAESQYLDTVYIFNQTAWNDYKYRKKIKTSVPVQGDITSLLPLTVLGAFFLGYLVSYNFGCNPLLPLEFAAIPVALYGIYYLGLTIAELIANLFTSGAYKDRKETFIVAVESKKEKENRVREMLNNLVDEIVRNGGYAQSLIKKRDLKLKEETLEANQKHIKYYTKYFNMGKTILVAAITFFLLLETIRLLQIFYFKFSTVTETQALLYWRIPLLVFSLLGLFLLIRGNSDIERSMRKIKGFVST